MNTVGDTEERIQGRLVTFFQDALGYEYLGDWQSRENNSNIDKTLLTKWLHTQKHNDRIIKKVLDKLKRAADVGGTKTLYDANRKIYDLLRYGAKVRPNVGQQHITVKLIDWENPHKNLFGIAEEVTLQSQNTNKRPDLVLYINGIAIGVLELKRSTVSVSEGIRQNITNQEIENIGWFFSTVQLVMAGSESQGIRYSVINTDEKYWLQWKEPNAHPDAGENLLHRDVSQLCEKARLLEILHDFIVFDGETKKICRHNQYFSVKAAQEKVQKREGGIIWNTQGSGKSLTMVWLAKWILEDNANARVLIITDRTELDDQIEGVFQGVNEKIIRTKSGRHLLRILSNSTDRLLCSLVHKFRSSPNNTSDIDDYVADIEALRQDGFQPKGEIYVFVDECHRTQSGKLHRAMKTLLPDAVLIGFTGTPLLRADRQRSIEIFGPYIHTYKYDEGVHDNVVLDLRYEARDIDQDITSQQQIDQFFEEKTQGLTDTAKAQLKQRWGTLLNVESSRERLAKIVADIVVDMNTRPRLMSGRGNAMLVANSIYSACRFYDLFQETELKGKCAVVTSYRPMDDTNRQQEYNTYRKMLSAYFNEPEETVMHRAEEFEKAVKKDFVHKPAEMKLLIVVDKLLTGFDAPPATYLYIDKKMQDHGLFQAICRVNRLDGDDKDFGYIIDYKDLFRSLRQAITDYTGEAFANFDAEDVAGLLKDRLEKGKERLDDARDRIKGLCEPVDPPKDTSDYIRYFCCEEIGNDAQIRANEPKRIELYKLTAAFVRAYANIANEMIKAGYTEVEAQEIKDEVSHYDDVCQIIKLASGDYIDLKDYEPDMRQLLDTYIEAADSETISNFDNTPLVELLVDNREDAITALPEGIRNNEDAVASTIANNVRRLIVDRLDINPRYYEELSNLLDDLIQDRRQGALDYREYLSQIADLSGQVREPERHREYPEDINTPSLRALFDNLDIVQLERRETGVIALDNAVRDAIRDNWRGNVFKERRVKRAIENVIQNEFSDLDIDVDAIFELVKNQDEY